MVMVICPIPKQIEKIPSKTELLKRLKKKNTKTGKTANGTGIFITDTYKYLSLRSFKKYRSHAI